MTEASTFLSSRRVFVRRLVVFLLAAQVTRVDGHSSFDLLLSKLHSLIEDFEELFRLIVTSKPMEK